MQTKKRAKPVKFGKAAQAEVKKDVKEASSDLNDLKEVIKQAVREEIEEVAAEEDKTTSKKIYIDETVTHHAHEVAKAAEVKEELPEVEVKEEPQQEVEPESLDSDEKEELSVKESESKGASDDTEKSEQEEEIGEETPIEEDSRITRSRLADPDEDSPFSSDGPPATVEKGKNHFLYFLVVATITFVLGFAFIVGGYYALQNKNFSFSDMTQLVGMGPTPTAEPTATPEATPTAEPVDLSAYTITVLNGSGITGEAAKVKTFLIDEGYKVGSTGNADLSDYIKTQIKANSNVSKAYLEQLSKSLGKTYSVDSSSSSGPSEGADVTVIIGSDKSN